MPDAFCIFYQKRASEKLLHLLDSPKVHCPLFPSLNALLLHSAHWLVNCVSPAKRQRTLCRLTNEQSRAGVRREEGGCSATPEQLGWNGTNWLSHKAGCVQLCRKSAMYKPSSQSLPCKGTVYPRRREEREGMQTVALFENLGSALRRQHSLSTFVLVLRRETPAWCFSKTKL